MRSVILTFACGLALSVVGCGKAARDGAGTSPASGASARARSARSLDVDSLLTREEVGAIIGVPVTALEEHSASSVTYKTANPLIEARLEVTRKGAETISAAQEMESARMVTRRFGGNAEAVKGIGDDAFFGAFNFLYVRKGEVIFLVTPPNLQQAAENEQAMAMANLPPGSEEQQKASAKLAEIMKTDPATKSLAQPDATAGADYLKHVATSQGTEYEGKARAMARAMAGKVLARIAV